MDNLKKFVPTIVFALTGALACSGDNGSVDAVATTVDAVPTAVDTDPSLLGAWSRGCYGQPNDDDSDDLDYFTESLTFTADAFTQVNPQFGDDACTSLVLTQTKTGTYAVESQVTTTGGKPAHQIVFTISSWTLNPANVEIAEMFAEDSTFSTCAPYAPGAETDLLPCSGMSVGDPIRQDIYTADGAGLTFGDGDGATDADGYPAELSRRYILTR